MMKNLIVSNWKQVYRSLAIWLPILGLTLYEFLQQATSFDVVPDHLHVPVAATMGILGWLIKQPKIRRGMD